MHSNVSSCPKKLFLAPKNSFPKKCGTCLAHKSLAGASVNIIALALLQSTQERHSVYDHYLVKNFRTTGGFPDQAPGLVRRRRRQDDGQAVQAVILQSAAASVVVCCKCNELVNKITN